MVFEFLNERRNRCEEFGRKPGAAARNPVRLDLIHYRLRGAKFFLS